MNFAIQTLIMVDVEKGRFMWGAAPIQKLKTQVMLRSALTKVDNCVEKRGKRREKR